MIVLRIGSIWRNLAEKNLLKNSDFTDVRAQEYADGASGFIQSSDAKTNRWTEQLCAASHFPSTHSVQSRFVAVPKLKLDPQPKVQRWVELFQQSWAATKKMSSEVRLLGAWWADCPTNPQLVGMELTQKQHSVSFPLYSTPFAFARGVFLRLKYSKDLL